MGFASNSGKEAEAQNIQAMSARVWGGLGNCKDIERGCWKGNKSHILERRIEHEKTTIRWDYFNVMVLQTC